jgi:Mn2+/Fe2+ NRAMP family transporter
VKQPWGQILYSTVIPHVELTRDYLLNIVAIIGTTISPYLFFWQANQEVEEAIDQHRPKAIDSNEVDTAKSRSADRHIQRLRQDTTAGMCFSNFIAFFIIATTASTLGAHGIHNIETAEQAAEALKPLAGEFAFVLFALGIVGTGLLAVPVLAGSASYAIVEAAGWKSGLYKKLDQAHGFYGVITLATLLGLLVNFTSIQPFKMLYYTAVLNGIAAPPLMVLILLIGNNERIMGRHRNGRRGNILGWAITIVMGIIAVALLVSLVT